MNNSCFIKFFNSNSKSEMNYFFNTKQISKSDKLKIIFSHFKQLPIESKIHITQKLSETSMNKFIPLFLNNFDENHHELHIATINALSKFNDIRVFLLMVKKSLSNDSKISSIALKYLSNYKILFPLIAAFLHLNKKTDDVKITTIEIYAEYFPTNLRIYNSKDYLNENSFRVKKAYLNYFVHKLNNKNLNTLLEIMIKESDPILKLQAFSYVKKFKTELILHSACELYSKSSSFDKEILIKLISSLNSNLALLFLIKIADIFNLENNYKLLTFTLNSLQNIKTKESGAYLLKYIFNQNDAISRSATNAYFQTYKPNIEEILSGFLANQHNSQSLPLCILENINKHNIKIENTEDYIKVLKIAITKDYRHVEDIFFLLEKHIYKIINNNPESFESFYDLLNSNDYTQILTSNFSQSSKKLIEKLLNDIDKYFSFLFIAISNSNDNKLQNIIHEIVLENTFSNSVFCQIIELLILLRNNNSLSDRFFTDKLPEVLKINFQTNISLETKKMIFLLFLHFNKLSEITEIAFNDFHFQKYIPHILNNYKDIMYG